jgi:hypothetical protein
MKDAFFVARLHPKEYADYCASMRESNKVSDTAEKETERLKMMRDAGISEGSNGASSSFTGKGSSGDVKIAASEDSTAPSSSADGDGSNPSGGVTVKLEGETVVKLEYQAKMDVDSNPSAASSASNGVSFSEGSTEKADEGSESLRVDTTAEGESMDCDAKDDELDAPPQTPSGPGSGAMTPAGSRSSRRVKGRGAKAETTVSEETEDKDSESSEIAIGVAKKDCETDNPELVLSESKTSEEDTPPQNSNVSVASGQIVKDEMTESPYIKAEDEGKPAVDDFSSGEGAEASVKSDFEASSSSSSSRPPLFAIPGTTKVEIIKGVFLTDDTEDVDDTLESEHFDTRQSFLNLCQGNHYQFDQLRRAKHTSMMVLYHMHNPDAPKFVPNCNMCHKDILIGHKYRCEPCEQDYCPACYSLHGIRIHAHPLRPMAVSAMVTPPALTDEQRRQRQQAIDLHLTLLVHASSCVLGSDCKSRHCQKMKVSTPRIRKYSPSVVFAF